MLLLLIGSSSGIFTASTAIVPRRLVRARAPRVIMQKLLGFLLMLVVFKTKHFIFKMVLGRWQNILSRGLRSLRISLLAVAIRSRHIFLLWMEELSRDWFVNDLFGRIGRLLVIIDLRRTLFLHNGLLEFKVMIGASVKELMRVLGIYILYGNHT